MKHLINKHNVFASTLFCLFWLSSNCQMESNWWLFGKQAALNFNTSPPTALTLGVLNQHEGSASYSNPKTGQLMFYTDGITIFDRFHRPMPNGSGLYGSSTSSHSAYILPFPNDTNRFMVISVPYPSSKGLYSAEVNMTLNGGAGDVDTTKKKDTNNIWYSRKYFPVVDTLYDPIDKVAGTNFYNNVEYWLVSQSEYYTEFHARKLGSQGWREDTNSLVKSTSGITLKHGLNKIPAYGCMKFSPDGSKLAVAYGPLNVVMLYSFNNGNGKVSIPREVKYVPQGNNFLPYGLEFSPNSKYLYVNSNGIIQFNTDLDSANFISASGVMITPDSNSLKNGQLQLGPDKKIYFADGYNNSIGVIHLPNLYAKACKWKHKALQFGSNSKVRLGLPTFNTSNISKNELKLKDGCIGQPSSIKLANISDVDSVHFSFGDPGSGSSNFGKGTPNSHTYSNPGAYQVKGFVYRTNNLNRVVIDTLYDSIYIAQRPTISLGNDTIMCWGDTIFANLTNKRFTLITWQDSSTNSFISVKRKGKYVVTALNKCGVSKDSINIIRLLNEGLNLGSDTVLCDGNAIKFDISDTLATYLWDNGSKHPVRTINKSGVYWARSQNFCGVYKDTIKVDFDPKPHVDLGSDTAVCDTVFFFKNVNTKGATYVWQDSSTADQYNFAASGKYWVEIKNACGTASDTFNLNFEQIPYFQLGNDTIICNQDSIYVLAYPKPPNYLWSNGDTANKLKINQAGKYWLTSKNSCGSISDTILVDTLPQFYPKINYSGGIFKSVGLYKSYLWYFNGTPMLGGYGPSYRSNGPGHYQLRVTSSDDCMRFSNRLTMQENGEILGLNKLASNKVLIYPNPASDFIVIENLAQHQISYEIIDVKGNIIQRGICTPKNESCRLNINNLVSGSYILKTIVNQKPEFTTIQIVR